MKEELFDILFEQLKKSGFSGQEAHKLGVVIIDQLDMENWLRVGNQLLSLHEACEATAKLVLPKSKLWVDVTGAIGATF